MSSRPLDCPLPYLGGYTTEAGTPNLVGLCCFGHAAEDAFGLGDAKAGNGVGAALGAGHGVDAQFVGVALGADVGDVAVVKVDANAVNVIKSGNRAKAIGELEKFA